MGFRDSLSRIEALGAVVVGMSPDTPDALMQFREKFDLPFQFLSDPGGRVAEKYGAWQERTRDGVTSMGISRSTFIIGADGKIARAFANVQVDGHIEEVLAAL